MTRDDVVLAMMRAIHAQHLGDWTADQFKKYYEAEWGRMHAALNTVFPEMPVPVFDGELPAVGSDDAREVAT